MKHNNWMKDVSLLYATVSCFLPDKIRRTIRIRISDILKITYSKQYQSPFNLVKKLLLTLTAINILLLK